MRVALLAAVAALGLTVSGIQASAATCNADALGKISGASACETGSTNNDFLSTPLQVNEDSLFDISTWTYLGKLNFEGDSENPALLGISGGLQAGTFSIAQSIFDAYDTLMLVLKGGNGENTNPNYVGYLLTSRTGSYGTPFFNLDNGNLKDISHITLYGAVDDETPSVPLPAAGFLLVAGLAAMAGLGRRKAS